MTFGGAIKTPPFISISDDGNKFCDYEPIMDVKALKNKDILDTIPLCMFNQFIKERCKESTNIVYVLDDFNSNHILYSNNVSDEDIIDHFQITTTMQVKYLGKIQVAEYKTKKQTLIDERELLNYITGQIIITDIDIDKLYNITNFFDLKKHYVT